MNLCRYFLPLLIVLLLSGPLSAQVTDEDGQFYLDFAGSAVFPYDPKTPAGLGLKAGAGFTAAFGYTFKEGFSTEVEWGYQKVGIGVPPGAVIPTASFGGLFFDGPSLPVGTGITLTPPTVEIDGEIKTPSLMGNFYYRYPKWRVSPYVGFGLGAFFHDRTVTSTITFGDFLTPVLVGPAGPLSPTGPRPHKTTVAYKDSRFAYQIMGGLLVRVSKRVDFHLGYRFRSSRGAEFDADRIEAGIRLRF